MNTNEIEESSQPVEVELSELSSYKFVTDSIHVARLPQIFKNTEKDDVFKDEETGIMISKRFDKTYRVIHPDKPNLTGLMDVSCGYGQLRPSDALVLSAVVILFGQKGAFQPNSNITYINTTIREIRRICEISKGGKQNLNILSSLSRISRVLVSTDFYDNTTKDLESTFSLGFLNHEFTLSNMKDENRIFLNPVLLDQYRNNEYYALEYELYLKLPKGCYQKFMRYVSSFFRDKSYDKSYLEIELNYFVRDVLSLENVMYKCMAYVRKMLYYFETLDILKPSEISFKENNVEITDEMKKYLPKVFVSKNINGKTIEYIRLEKGGRYEDDCEISYLPNNNTGDKINFFHFMSNKIGLKDYFADFLINLAKGSKEVPPIKERKNQEISRERRLPVYESVMLIVGKGVYKNINQVTKEEKLYEGYDYDYLKKVTDYVRLHLKYGKDLHTIKSVPGWFRAGYLGNNLYCKKDHDRYIELEKKENEEEINKANTKESNKKVDSAEKVIDISETFGEIKKLYPYENGDKVFKGIKASIRNDTNYKTWFSNSVFIYIDKMVVLVVPNHFNLNWIQRKYDDLIDAAAGVKVVYKTLEDTLLYIDSLDKKRVNNYEKEIDTDLSGEAIVEENINNYETELDANLSDETIVGDSVNDYVNELNAKLPEGTIEDSDVDLKNKVASYDYQQIKLLISDLGEDEAKLYYYKLTKYLNEKQKNIIFRLTINKEWYEKEEGIIFIKNNSTVMYEAIKEFYEDSFN